MILSVFAVSFLSAIAAYAWLYGRIERRDTALALRRLVPKSPQQAAKSRRRPLLIAAVDEMGGRLARRLLESLRLKDATERLLESAALKWGASGFLHRSVALFLAGFAIATVATRNSAPLAAIAAGAAVGLAPLVYARKKAAARVRKFEEQFPDCLEFLSRSMRAGHAFSAAIEMVEKEYSDPLAAEFRRCFEEQNLGQPMEIVLRKLSQRIPSMDVQFFVSAVLLQKRTGGNLAEVLDNLAQLIRERFKLRARIRAVSAQGIMSGRILAAIPLAVAGLMFLVNPEYARFFVVDPTGHQLVGAALGLELIGYLIIRKIVRFDI